MRYLSRLFVLGLVFLQSAACGAPTPTSSAPKATSDVTPARSEIADAVRAALTGPTRKPDDRARDQYRHPVETLEFFGLRADATVLEIGAGFGWYTAVLAPVLKGNGELTVTSPDPNGPPEDENTQEAKGLAARFAAAPDVFGGVKTRIIRRGEPLSYGEDNSVDFALALRTIHAWYADDRLGKVLEAVHRVLKPGGVLGVEAHRANPGAPTDKKSIEKSGYMPEGFVVSTIEAAGFQLVARSELNANPKDTKDHPKGVWSLPPTYAEKDVNRSTYTAIGESDRMTLKFVKK